MLKQVAEYTFWLLDDVSVCMCKPREHAEIITEWKQPRREGSGSGCFRPEHQNTHDDPPWSGELRVEYATGLAF